MVRAVTSFERTKLRGNRQFCELGLLMPTPKTVISGRLTGSPSSNNSVVELPWGLTSGSQLVEPGMSCWVGTKAGAYDIGVVRIRKMPTSSTLYISETSDINWRGDEYITIVREFAPWRRDIRVVNETTFYMDWDIAYSDQHSNPAPLVSMGIDSVVDVSKGEVLVPWDASKSTVISGSLASFSWASPSASSGSNLNSYQAVIGVDQPGSHQVSCLVTTVGGAQHKGFRFIHAYDDDHPPIWDFEVTSLEGNFEDGGWQGEFRLYEAKNIPDRARIILFARDWYQMSEGSLGYIPNRENIVFIGWVIGKSVTVDPITNTTTFRAASPHYWLRRIRSFPGGVEDTDFADNGGGQPNRWTEMEDLTPAKGLWHFLHWRTTMTLISDITLPIDSRQAARTNTGIGTLWDQLITMSNQVNLSFPVFDQFGRLFIQRNLQYMPLSQRSSIPVVMTLDEDDCSSISIEPRVIPGLSYAEVTGVWFSHGDNGPMGGVAPGDVPRSLGEGERIFSELVMGTQAEAIELAGLILGAEADDPASITLEVEELNRMFSIAEHCYVQFTMPENSQGLSYSNKKLIPRTIRYNFKVRDGFHSTSLTCVAEGLQLPAIAKKFPGSNDPPVDPPEEPPKPPDPPGPPPPPPPKFKRFDAIVTTLNDIRACLDISDETPPWETEIASNPKSIVDSCPGPNEDTMFAIKEGEVWRARNMSMEGAATWDKIWDGSTDMVGGELEGLLRVVFRTDVLYVLGWGTHDASGDKRPFRLRATYGGQDTLGTWDLTWIEEEISASSGGSLQVTGVEYSDGNSHASFSGSGASVTGTINFNALQFPICRDYAYVKLGSPMPQPIPPSDSVTLEYDITGDSPSLDYDTDGDNPMRINYLTFGPVVGGSFTPTSGGYHFSGWIKSASVLFGANHDELKIGWPYGIEARWADSRGGAPPAKISTLSNLVIGGTKYGGQPSRAFDVAPTNTNWLYLGLKDKILKSEDGGFTWDTLTDEYGANDIRVDNLIAGWIFVWTTEGELISLLDGVFNQLFDTETPYDQYGRIGRIPNWGDVWYLKEDSFHRYALGSSSLLASDLSEARGLFTALGRKLIYIDNNAIYYSDDGGNTVKDITGDWAAYSGPISSFLTSRLIYG